MLSVIIRVLFLGSGIQWEYRLSDGRAIWQEYLADHCPSSPVIGFDKADVT